MSTARDTITSKLAVFTERCRAGGFRVTPQRLEILRQVVQTDAHPDAEDLHKRVRRRMPTVSLDTVYRTLRFLEEAGLVQRLSRLHGSARFDANLRQHHHFVCRRCGKVMDFYSEALDQLRGPPELGELGTVESFHAEVHGVCKACESGPGGRSGAWSKATC